MNFEASGKFAEIFTSEKKERKKGRKKREEKTWTSESHCSVLSPRQKHTLESIFKNREICQVYAVITDMFT